MNALRVGIIGAGAAGTATAKSLRQSEADLAVELLTRTGEQPYNRTLVNKGVAIGLLERPTLIRQLSELSGVVRPATWRGLGFCVMDGVYDEAIGRSNLTDA